MRTDVQSLMTALDRDGPILNVDDDAYILPELLRKVWKTRVVSAWQVGNFDLMPEFQPSQCEWLETASVSPAMAC